MANVFTKVRFSRCREIQPDRNTAMLHLCDKEFSPGEPVLVNYTDDDHASINTIMAVGIKQGKGQDCYKVISLGQFEIIWGIFRGSLEVPDVSCMVHDELYLWQNPDGVWYYVSIHGTERVFEPLLPYPQTFINVADNTIYVSDSDRHVRSINDVYTKSEIDDLLSSISGGQFSSLSALEQRLNDAYLAIYEVKERNDELTEVIEGMQDSLAIVEEFGDKVEDIESRVSTLEVDSESGDVSGTFSSIEIKDSDDSNIIINKDTVITSENIEYYLGEETSPIPPDILDQTLT